MKTKLPIFLESTLLATTVNAAVACFDFIGKGDNNAADAAAVASMRSTLGSAEISGVVKIGEGERDEAPMLYIGEKVGRGGVVVDIALDPLEGTTICANGAAGALTVAAFGGENCFLHAPDVYMEKIAVGPRVGPGVVSLKNTVEENIKNIATKLGVKVCDISAIVLNRSRHESIINTLRQMGCKIKLIEDGDIAACIEVATKKESHVYLGSGGAPEGVLSACALKAIGGYMQGKLVFKTTEQEERAKEMGVKNLDKVYEIEDMVKGDCLFACTGVTDGPLLKGVKFKSKNKSTQTKVESLLFCSQTQSTKKIKQKFMLDLRTI